MLLSMTGHGEGHTQQDGISVAVEVRTINNRYLKLAVRCAEGYNSLEPQIESVIREHIRRGTVQVNVRVDREPSPDDYKLNHVVLASYRRQLESLYDQLHIADSLHIEALLDLPGVVDERAAHGVDVESEWPVVEQTLVKALEHVTQMRAREGRAMAEDLKQNCRQIGDSLDKIDRRAPLVVEAYRSRITDRLNGLLAEFEVTVQPAEIVREVGIFAERCDISEEIVRMRSHLEQFATIMDRKESQGRKLDFLTQEMFRETNTIGSKANDAEIAQHVIDIKTSIERMREMIQNVE